MPEGLEQFGSNIGSIFINLSSEYAVFLNVIFIIFAATGVCIGCSAIMDIMKAGRRDSQHQTSSSSVFWKMVASASLVDIAFWANIWTSSLWQLDDPMGISEYAANGSANNLETAMYAAIGFIVLAGYVTLGRAYLMVGKIGYLSQEARSDIIGSIIARVVAGSLMIACLHVSKAVDNSAGFNWIS